MGSDAHTLKNGDKNGSIMSEKQDAKAEQKGDKSVPIISKKLKDEPLESNINEGTILTLKLMYFFFNASISCINPFLSVYYNSLGMDSGTIGVLNALKPLTALVVTPIWGILADRSGATSYILMITTAMATLLRMCLLLPGAYNVWFLTVIILLMSTFFAPIKSLSDSVVMSSLPSGQKSMYGKIREWGPLGKIISSPLIAYVISNSNNGFLIAFTASAVFSFPVLLCTMSLKSTCSDSKGPEKQKKASFFETFQIVNENKPLLYFFSLIFIFGCAFGFVEAFVYVHVRQIFVNLNIPSNVTMSLCRLCIAVGGAIGYRISGRFISKCGTMISMLISLVSLAIGFFLYAESEKLTFLVSLQTVLFIAEIIRASSCAIMWSTATVHVTAITAPGMSSSTLAFMDSVYTGLGYTFGCMLGGKAITELGGIAIAFAYVGWILLGIATLMVVILSGIMEHRKKIK